MGWNGAMTHTYNRVEDKIIGETDAARAYDEAIDGILYDHLAEWAQRVERGTAEAIRPDRTPEQHHDPT
jgi:hypothetical protein